MNYLISSVIGFLLGSIPTAYLILKFTRGIDIREAGSANVGAMNSYEVSDSKWLGLTVMLIDIAKGAMSALLPLLIFGDTFIWAAMASIFAVFAHCYNPWLGFKGGRGLATFAGSAIVLFPYLLVIWLVLWVVFYLLKKDILFSNISAIIMSLILVFSTPKLAIKYANPSPDSVSTLMFFTVSGLIIIFIKHIDSLKELIYDKKIFKMKRNE